MNKLGLAMAAAALAWSGATVAAAEVRFTIKLTGSAEIFALPVTVYDGYEAFGIAEFDGPVLTTVVEINEDYPAPYYGGQTYAYFYNHAFTRISDKLYQVRVPDYNYVFVRDDGTVERSVVDGRYVTALFQSDAPYTYTVTSEAVPEPGAWAMMILGFGLAGGAIRRCRQDRLPESLVESCRAA